MSVPESVKQAELEADEAVAAFEKELEEETSQSEALDQVPADEDDQTPEGEEQPQDPPHEEEPPAPKGDEEVWKQRYQTLLGKYNAEVPRMARDLDYLRGQVATLSQSREQEAEEPEKKKADQGYKKYLKEKELEEYDADILDFQSRIARGEAEAAVSPMLTRLMQRIQTLEGQLQERKGSSFWDTVEKHFPGARQLNDSDPLWADYLEKVDPFSGRRLREVGEKAVAAGDVGRIVQLMRDYTGKAAPEPVEDTGEEAPRVTPPVKPSRAKGEPSRSAVKEKPVFRSSDIDKFFADVSRGHYASREKDRAARERAIEQAVMEGRVVPG